MRCAIMIAMKKPELLAPAGNLEKLKVAVHYGADAVYVSGKRFGLRAAAGNFTLEEMKEGIDYAHERGVKLYVTVNIFFHNDDLAGLPGYLQSLEGLGVDAVIVSDPGIVAFVREVIPDIEIHLSTQANTTNWRSVKFWKEQGVGRINLARELTLDEIGEIKDRVSDIGIEAFVHGAVCMAYSGRCHLSSHMTGRDANNGECTHSCRWEYSIQEAKRPLEVFDVEEDSRGTYFFNSRDLCMIEHIPALVETGIDSFKIEGRVKGVNYVAGSVRSYRLAIDSYFRDPEGYVFNGEWLEELKKLNHRDYDTGFYLGRECLASGDTSYVRRYDFVGIVRESLGDNRYLVEARNKVVAGDILEVMGRGEKIKRLQLDRMTDPEGAGIPHAQPGQLFIARAPFSMEPMDIIRREKGGTAGVVKAAL